jgi:glyoxylase-like metal-dependent hydrolase (beta-lactamase superfamily II)
VTPLSFGDVSVQAVLESARLSMPFAEFLPDSTPEALAREREWLEPRFGDLAAGLGYLSFHSYLVRTPRATILVDACIGNDKDRGGHAAFHMLRTDWLANLEATGVRPVDVDFVMCTHMHADHVGWNTRLVDGRWVPTFPRARYVFARTEYEHRRRQWREQPGFAGNAFADSVLPVVESGQALIVEADHDLDGHVTLEPAPGHTPGNVVIHARSRGEAAVFSGDVIHHPVQVVHPEWSARFCEDPVRSAACRRRFVETHGDAGTLVLPAHFPVPSAGRIRRHGCGWRFAFVGE